MLAYDGQHHLGGFRITFNLECNQISLPCTYRSLEVKVPSNLLYSVIYLLTINCKIAQVSHMIYWGGWALKIRNMWLNMKVTGSRFKQQKYISHGTYMNNLVR